MSTHHGKAGVVRSGATNAVAEVVEFTIEESVDVVDDTVMGDTSKTHLIGVKSWKASVSCFWDETDTNGQQTFTIGASVTAGLYPEGVGSGATYCSGTATITGISIGVPKDGVVTRNFELEGNGALAWSTV